MKTLRGAFTLIEALVLASIVLLLAALIAPAVRLAADEDARKACNSNLSQLVKACITYQEPNGDFFPAHSQYLTGATDNFKPMPSLAILYPAYIDNTKVFGCPQTNDKPWVSIRWNKGAKWACFGTDVLGQPATNPVAYSGLELSTELKCSYFYDERSHFRNIGPLQAMACDADGQTFRQPDGPTYPANWTRSPRAPNHEGGQNVMYFDGFVKWKETPYCSQDPNDNIFCPNGGSTAAGGQWGADTDAYLWDGVNARAKQLDPKPRTLGAALTEGSPLAVRMSEAIAGVGAIRTAARVYLANRGGTFPNPAPTLAGLGIRNGDLDGKYFDHTCYIFRPTPGAATYTIEAKLLSDQSKTYKIDQSGLETGTFRTGG